MSGNRTVSITLCDLQPELVSAWERLFGNEADVEIIEGDLTEVYADAYVSPANSYGYMDGGIDLALRERFSAYDIERKVQERIAELGGLLPVGEAIVVETGDDEVAYLVSAATMEVPSHVGHPNNAYLAMNALLRAVEAHNAEQPGSITSLGIPGLCTGVGGMEAEIAARQMHLAYTEWREAA